MSFTYLHFALANCKLLRVTIVLFQILRYPYFCLLMLFHFPRNETCRFTLYSFQGAILIPVSRPRIFNYTRLPLSRQPVYFGSRFCHKWQNAFFVAIFNLRLKTLWSRFCHKWQNVLVEIMRFELMTPCLQGRCSPNWAIPPHEACFECPKWAFKIKQYTKNEFWVTIHWNSMPKTSS